ncbi:hypothetical protein QAD02_014031 [Eretmocerus hayati]|uniref:Uncharacterized protein n=1 Tax=Eretmocerus hayati TaxID=131215 RepID=A0ACC2P6N1_9HYME|nr:hypothetical protein QAD02_014031 [Eretmocerus hayati]
MLEKNEILQKLNDELKEKNSLLKENNELMKEKVNSQMTKQKSSIMRNYAQVTSYPRPEMNRQNIPAIVVELKGQGGEKTETINRVKKTLGEKTNCPINKVEESKDKIFIKCRDPQDVKTEDLLKMERKEDILKRKEKKSMNV